MAKFKMITLKEALSDDDIEFPFCSECIFYDDDDFMPNERFKGCCRRYPPLKGDQGWVIVNSYDYCGELVMQDEF
jgi:hypothetical protein